MYRQTRFLKRLIVGGADVPVLLVVVVPCSSVYASVNPIMKKHALAARRGECRRYVVLADGHSSVIWRQRIGKDECEVVVRPPLKLNRDDFALITPIT